jgi:hypothetical protein
MKVKIMRWAKVTVWLLWYLLVGGLAPADEWMSPQEVVLRSPNGGFEIRVIPGKSWGDLSGFTGAPTGEYAKAMLKGLESQEERTYTLLNPVAPVEAILLDDGSLLTFDNWHNMGYGKVIVLYDRTGQVLWSHELEDLFPKDQLKQIPTSVSSRWWRKHPLEYQVERVSTVRLVLWNGDRMAIHLSDGSVERGAP